MPWVIILKTIFIFQLWSPNLLAYNSKKCIEPTFPFWINNMVVQNYIWTLLEHSCIWNILSYLHVHSFMELRIKLHLTSLHNVNISNVILYHSTIVLLSKYIHISNYLSASICCIYNQKEFLHTFSISLPSYIQSVSNVSFWVTVLITYYIYARQVQRVYLKVWIWTKNACM